VWVWALLVVMCPAGETPADWRERVRDRVAARDLPAALQIVDARLTDVPDDLEARGWRARLLAWSGHWPEAETEYRRVLESAPNDVDMLIGLSNVLTWQARHEEALALLDRAEGIDPARADILLSRGRTLRAANQPEQARRAFARVLTIEAGNPEAQAGLAALVAPEPRFTLLFGTDIDTFNFTDAAYTFTTSLTAQINPKWVTNVSIVGQDRFGEGVGTFLPSVGYRLTRRDSLTVGGGLANAQAVGPTGSLFLEYGRGFTLGEEGFFQSIETSYKQHWYWYEGARVTTLTPRITLNLPRQWSWSLQITAARSRFTDLPVAWSPAGLTRLNFPIHGTLSGNSFFAVGTEDFARVDQIGTFSARTWGAGLSYWHQRHHFSGYLARQDRSQDRTQLSYGGSYAIRF
jgi:tetratricopeptide (TPR) repeat protein